MGYKIKAHQRGDEVVDDEVINEKKNIMELYITIGEHTLYRCFAITDGAIPENTDLKIQDMVDTLLAEEN